MPKEVLPVIAVVGRPNVGKSSFVNRISGRGDAIVHGERGVTRDRSYHEADWAGTSFILIDTGGIEMARDDVFQTGIRTQAEVAMEQADAIILLVDGQTGLTADDESLARLLKRTKKPVFLAVNKVDDPTSERETYEFWNLGLGEPYPLSATHGTGTGDLFDEVIKSLPELKAEAEANIGAASIDDSSLYEDSDFDEDYLDDLDEDEAKRISRKPVFNEDDPIKVAVIGRPNAGKSSLTNRLSNMDRSIVSDVAGTTRDAIDTDFVYEGREITLVDTAGIRRKAVIDSDVEYYGFVRAMRAIDRADVALLVIDAEIGLTDQDQRIASYAQERGRAIVVLLNKWDLMKQESAELADEAERARKILMDRIEDRLGFISWAPVLRVSAKSGRGLDRILDAVITVFGNYRAQYSTSVLNRFLTELRQFGHTVSRGPQKLSIKYMAQTHYEPPGFTFFCNHPNLVDDTYKRYLENRLREHFELSGTPVIMKFKHKT
ncbi:MAG: ribosome biogenesis GTPase Der [Coriobacteriia bacterium]|nr:ribosome biogenesis GTPase Der [Coriobacteriia bacterium]MCL2745874.1 ribosome biogenesis GTPase Der [Coriobacteriia bacterium]MCL2870330.1 ribosome biogenesis GTPase Der [Coriobacteriia bacterium]